jgi:hypothetical protein
MSLYCIQNDIEFHNPTPSAWRKTVGIKNGRGILRDEQKAQAIKAVKDWYGIDVGDDIAEAIEVTAPTAGGSAHNDVILYTDARAAVIQDDSFAAAPVGGGVNIADEIATDGSIGGNTQHINRTVGTQNTRSQLVNEVLFYPVAVRLV